VEHTQVILPNSPENSLSWGQEGANRGQTSSLISLVDAICCGVKANGDLCQSQVKFCIYNNTHNRMVETQLQA
jgi:hypothetical protein